MKRVSVLVLIGLSIAAQANAAQLEKKKVLAEMTAIQQEYSLPSLSVAIGLGKNVVFADAVGFADIEKKTVASSATQYSVGSLAKPMTGLAAARLVDSGKLKLDVPVSTYVDTPQYTSRFNVLELAGHVAGVPHDTQERDQAEFVAVKDHQNPKDAFYVFDTHDLLFEPGTGFRYSSNGYILLSEVVEQAANSNYVAYLDKQVWQPLGMDSTELDTSFAGKDSEATYYAQLNEDGSHQPATTQRDRSFLFGGGGFISTPSDMVKMAQGTYDVSFLADEARAALFSPVLLRNGEANEQNYALGWRVGQLSLHEGDEQTWYALHHGGVTDKAATSYVLVIPECQASISFATNYIPDKFWRIRGRMASILLGVVDKDNCQPANIVTKS